LVFEQLVRLATDLRGRSDDIATARTEVQVVSGQPPVALVGSGEVGVQSPARGADVGTGPVQEPFAVEFVECGVSVAVGVNVDVEDIGPGQPGGDGDIAFGVARPPPGDLVRVGGGVEEPVLGGRDLLPRDAGEYRPGRLGIP
jgi:hypothetical protein